MPKLHLRPAPGFIIVRPDVEESVRKVGSLFITSIGTKDEPSSGIVDAVVVKWEDSRGVHESAYRPGQRVVFSKFSGTKVSLDERGSDYVIILKEMEIKAIIEEVPDEIGEDERVLKLHHAGRELHA